MVFDLCAPDVAFLTKIAAPAFGINDSGWLRAHVSATGGGDQPIVSQVNGTGPYRLESWDRGTEISLARNDAYWGKPAKNERLIVRWGGDASERVVRAAERDRGRHRRHRSRRRGHRRGRRDPPGAATGRTRRRLPRVRHHRPVVQQREGQAGDRGRPRPRDDRRRRLPAGRGGGDPLHAVRGPPRLRRRGLAPVRPGPGARGAGRRRPAQTASRRPCTTARRRRRRCRIRAGSRQRSRPSS